MNHRYGERSRPVKKLKLFSLQRFGMMDGGDERESVGASAGVCRKAESGVQLREPSDENSPASKAGFKSIADIGRERIRRVIEDIKAEVGLADPTISTLGFKSFVLSPSNFKQWRGDGIEDPEALANQIQMFVESEKVGAKSEDIFFELLLKFGQQLTTPVERLTVEGVSVFAINNRKMLFVLEGFNVGMIDPVWSI